MKIKPGMLCYIVNCDDEANGRTVTTMQPYDSVIWAVTARWILTPLGRDWFLIDKKHLRPITGPKIAADIRITDETEALDDELVRVIAEARPV